MNQSKFDWNKFKEISELQIFRGDLKAGLLKRTKLGCDFEFDKDFLESNKFSSLSYKIPKSSQIYIHTGYNLPPFFAGLLPEGLTFKTLVKKLKTSEDDLFSILASIGDKTIGDIYAISKMEKTDSTEVKNAKDIDFYDYYVKTLGQSESLLEQESISGVQEKISASMISFPIKFAKKNRDYIFKLNPKDKKNLVENEYQCLKLANKCGIITNIASIVHDKNNNTGLLLQRFDRVADTHQKIHQEDGCQFLNLYPSEKYRVSFQQICEEIEKISSAPLIEIMKALKLYIFSYLIGNGDMHAKNISLQTDPNTGKIQLTPAYDLICTLIYGDNKMAMKLDGRDSNFKRRYFIDFGLRFGLNKKVMDTMIDKLLANFSKHHKMIFEIPNLTPNQKKHLISEFKKRTQSLE